MTALPFAGKTGFRLLSATNQGAVHEKARLTAGFSTLYIYRGQGLAAGSDSALGACSPAAGSGFCSWACGAAEGTAEGAAGTDEGAGEGTAAGAAVGAGTEEAPEEAPPGTGDS